MKVEIIATCSGCGALLHGTELLKRNCIACGQPWAVEESDLDNWGFEDPTETCPKCDGDRFVEHPVEDRFIKCDLCLGAGEIW